MSIRIQGHSDDVVVVNGQVTEEFYAHTPVIVSTSSGHQLEVRYDNVGTWRIVHHAGSEGRLTITVCDAEDGEGGQCSDLALIDADVRWVRCRPAEMDDPAELSNTALADNLDEIVSDFGPYRQELGDLAAAHEAVDRLRALDSLDPDPTGRIEVYIGDDGQHYWRLIDTSNGLTVAQGQGYVRRSDRDHLVVKRFGQYEVIDLNAATGDQGVEVGE